MHIRSLLIFVSLIYYANCVNSKNRLTANKTVYTDTTKIIDEHQSELHSLMKNKTKAKTTKIIPISKPNINHNVQKKKELPKIISPDLVQSWANEISEKLYDIEQRVVRREVLLKAFSDIKIELRNGTTIVNKMVEALEELLLRRAKAVDKIMRKAEELSQEENDAPPHYTFDYSVGLDTVKPIYKTNNWELPLSCRNVEKVHLENKAHFNAQVSLDKSSVYVSQEVFDCDPRVLPHLYWSEGLLSTFRENYAQDATLEFQYFCSAKGFLRHYPAALWENMFRVSLKDDEDLADVYDCRLRPWYVAAGGAPRDVLILLDASGSMTNSSNQIIAEKFTLALLSALTDDDQVNVLRFNTTVESPISCFNEKLVSANHVNSAAMMAAMKGRKMYNETKMDKVLEYAVRMLQKQHGKPDKPTSCQQAIVLVTDSLYDNYTDLLRHLDPDGGIRLFVMWLHDPFGLRDNTREFGDYISCERDGYFAELITHADVTEQVMRILRTLERPLVAQRVERLRVFSDMYAHIEDPRRAEYYWRQKENTEQVYRYTELRKNKEKLLNSSRLYEDYLNHLSLDQYGYYYEGEDIKYRFEISISVPVFDHTTVENVTIQLSEGKQRNSTRTYPVNRLLGVAGIDIPIDHLKYILPYYQLGVGALFIVDHRGNIVLHENMKPTFDGDILKPGYRTVDFLDLEQSAVDHLPRHYPREWLEFRKALIIEQASGIKTMNTKNILEGGMRVFLEQRQYYWRRVLNHYTAVVVLPAYDRRHTVPDGSFTQKLADDALRALSSTDFAVHPDWLYCRHIDPHFDSREHEVLHFIRRRSHESNFSMQNLKHFFSPIEAGLMEKTYQCNEELMVRLCKEAIATEKWALEHEEPGQETDRDCSTCELGSTTAFFASESGLTRWQQYHATSAHADPPEGSEWARGPGESWYRRASASPDTLVVHAPLAPVRRLRNSDVTPPPIGTRSQWLTAARTLVQPGKGTIGVAGYHFYPKHLEDVLEYITNPSCAEEDEDKCKQTCDGEDWSCLLIDESGWVVAGGSQNTKDLQEEPVRKHLATLHPAIMAALLNASVFKLHWLHDYQGVCFPPEDENITCAASTMPSIVTSLWHSMNFIFHLTRDLITVISIVSSGSLVSADTEFDKEKRRRRVKRDFEREKFERLYDPRVLINRTRFATCDRSRVFYELQRTPKAMKALKEPPNLCTWPLTGIVVPKTNLILIAVYNKCPYDGRIVPDPLVNEPVTMPEDESNKRCKQSSASKLACWRNRVPLPARAPHTACYPHNYTFEEGYRQCGPWLPDPEKSDTQLNYVSKILLTTQLLLSYCTQDF